MESEHRDTKKYEQEEKIKSNFVKLLLMSLRCTWKYSWYFRGKSFLFASLHIHYSKQENIGSIETRFGLPRWKIALNCSDNCINLSLFLRSTMRKFQESRVSWFSGRSLFNSSISHSNAVSCRLIRKNFVQSENDLHVFSSSSSSYRFLLVEWKIVCIVFQWWWIM